MSRGDLNKTEGRDGHGIRGHGDGDEGRSLDQRRQTSLRHAGAPLDIETSQPTGWSRDAQRERSLVRSSDHRVSGVVPPCPFITDRSVARLPIAQERQVDSICEARRDRA